jgi:hypothetical protein
MFGAGGAPRAAEVFSGTDAFDAVGAVVVVFVVAVVGGRDAAGDGGMVVVVAIGGGTGDGDGRGGSGDGGSGDGCGGNDITQPVESELLNIAPDATSVTFPESLSGTRNSLLRCRLAFAVT